MTDDKRRPPADEDEPLRLRGVTFEDAVRRLATLPKDALDEPDPDDADEPADDV